MKKVIDLETELMQARISMFLFAVYAIVREVTGIDFAMLLLIMVSIEGVNIAQFTKEYGYIKERKKIIDSKLVFVLSLIVFAMLSQGVLFLVITTVIFLGYEMSLRKILKY